MLGRFPSLAIMVVVLSLGGSAAVAAAKDGDVETVGTCTGAATAKLELSPEDGRIEVEFEVDQNRNGVTWRIVLRRNGSVAARARRRTRAPSGSFELRRLLADRPGPDRVVARAVSPGGQVCTAAATF